MNELNSVLFKSENQMHMFLLVDEQLSHPNSIPISDSENIYKDVTESQVILSSTKLSKDGSSVENKDYKEEDMANYSYDIKDIVSFSLAKGDNKEELKVTDVITSGDFSNLLKDLIGASKNES